MPLPGAKIEYKMQRVLFHETVFGPIHSRRLGTSLGVNLSPVDGKICTFDCLYCEAGFNAQGPGNAGLPPRDEVARLLRAKLLDMKERGQQLDVITFSGNGEPTVHPDFEGIVDDTLRLRDELAPQAKVSVLCNSTLLHRPGVQRALRRVDNNILKLDSAVPSTFALLDRPGDRSLTPERVVEMIRPFGQQCIVQTMMLRGSHNGRCVDNTTDVEIDALTDAYRKINPAYVMLYSIDRKTPEEQLRKVDKEELEQIADRFRAAGIKVQVN